MPWRRLAARAVDAGGGTNAEAKRGGRADGTGPRPSRCLLFGAAQRGRRHVGRVAGMGGASPALRPVSGPRPAGGLCAAARHVRRHVCRGGRGVGLGWGAPAVRGGATGSTLLFSLGFRSVRSTHDTSRARAASGKPAFRQPYGTAGLDAGVFCPAPRHRHHSRGPDRGGLKRDGTARRPRNGQGAPHTGRNREGKVGFQLPVSS